MKPARILGDERPHEEALAQMRERGGHWAAYRNSDVGHPQLGHLQFIKFGAGCTFALPPDRCPDTAVGLGWRYVFVGIVDLATGNIVDKITPATPAESSTT